jgi:hypothetical protein
MYRRAPLRLLAGMSYLFTPDGVLRRPFGVLAGVAGYAFVALLGVVTR